MKPEYRPGDRARLDPPGRGVWFQSQKGFWYRNRAAAGRIVCIQVDGHLFFAPKKAEQIDSLKARAGEGWNSTTVDDRRIEEEVERLIPNRGRLK